MRIATAANESSTCIAATSSQTRLVLALTLLLALTLFIARLRLCCRRNAYFEIKLPKPIVRSLWGLGGLFGGLGQAEVDDGLVHKWSMMLCVRLKALPSKKPLPILSGGPLLEPDEKVEHIQVYRNGGVGALGSMGTQGAAVRADRWTWITITREGGSKGKVSTYVNGIECASINLNPKKAENGGKGKEGGKGKPSKKRHEAAADEENNGEDGDDTISTKGEVCAHACRLALFGEPPDEDSQDLDEMADAEARGLMVRYLSVVAGEVWTPEQVRQKLHELRVRDEEEELTEAVELARQQKLTLRELYEKPPPIWFHPAFAAEVGDAFIAGTAFDSGSLSVSLEVMLLTLRRMQADDGVATKSLSHATLEALNSATDALDACCNLVYKKKHRLSDIYLRKVVGDIGALDPGELLLIPVEIRGTYRLLVVRRNFTPDEDTCSVTIVASGDYHDLRYHQSAAAPPKVRYRTSLELHGVPFERLCDEALWVSLSYAEKGSCRLYKGDDILYSVFVPYATERSLDHAMLDAHAECARKGVEDAPMRSTRRTRHDYGVLRSALHYLLTRVHGVSASTPSTCPR